MRHFDIQSISLTYLRWVWLIYVLTNHGQNTYSTYSLGFHLAPFVLAQCVKIFLDKQFFSIYECPVSVLSSCLVTSIILCTCQYLLNVRSVDNWYTFLPHVVTVFLFTNLRISCRRSDVFTVKLTKVKFLFCNLNWFLKNTISFFIFSFFFLFLFFAHSCAM